MQKINFNQTWVDTCVTESFDSRGKEEFSKDDNMYLRDMAKEWKKYGTHLYPSLVINDVTFRGQLNPDNVFEAICAGFDDVPDGC